MQRTSRVLCINGAIGNTDSHNKNITTIVGGSMSRNGVVLSKQSYEIIIDRAVITCKKCGATYGVSLTSINRNRPPHMIIKKFKNLGWDTKVDKTKAVCPECIEKRRMPVVKNAEEPKRPEGREIAEIHASLYEYFDSDKGEFRKGKSDQAIGKDLDIGWKYVKEIREEVYGKLKKDPEVQVVEMDIQKLEDRILKLGEQLQSRQDELIAATGEIRSRIKKLQVANND
jgi:hypothetical protein